MQRRLLVVFALLLLIAGAVFSSGTLAPYAATHRDALLSPKCGYLLNLDNEQFRATFLMLQGKPRELWESSVVLRRILYPLLAFPLMANMGFLAGGFITSLVIHLATALVLYRTFRNWHGERTALGGLFIYATYPGIFYWIGLPYSYACIVPFTILSFLLLLWFDHAPSWKRLTISATGIGFLALGYDLLPFFGPALLLILCRRTRLKYLAPGLLLLILPTILNYLVLNRIFNVPFNNSNTNIYGDIIRSYLSMPDMARWIPLLKRVPEIFVHNFLYSNFLVLPLGFLAFYVLLRLRFGTRLTLVERSFLLAAFAIYLFNNAAPPYDTRWQLRGEWIARLYQPVFVVYLHFIARTLSLEFPPQWKRMLLSLAVLIVGLQMVVVAGQPLKSPFTDKLYYQFYQHSKPGDYVANLEKHGVRPLGFCAQQK